MKIRLHILAALAAAPLSFAALADCVAVETGPAPQAAAAPAASPAATSPAASTAAGTFALPHAVALRDRPKADSVGDVVAPADKQVRLERSVSNADGTWWYVTANGIGGGWVLESEMGRPQQL